MKLIATAINSLRSTANKTYFRHANQNFHMNKHQLYHQYSMIALQSWYSLMPPANIT